MSSKQVLITGATSGIGLALVHRYCENNDNVIACGRNRKKLSTLNELVYQTCEFDITNRDSLQRAAQAIEPLDIAILNAGNCKYIDDVHHFNAEAFIDIINTNLTSLGNQLSIIIPKLKSGGQLVLVSSSATILPFPKAEAYGASKAGVDYLANSLRLDLKSSNIGVTLVHPGFVKTPLTDKNTFDMPFMISADEAAKRIYEGVEKRKNYLHFPKRLTLFLKTFALLPNILWQKMILGKQTQ